MPDMKIIYSGFYDAPLAFVTCHKDEQYLFWRGFFDDERDDYPSEFEVFILPNLSEEEIKRSWSFLTHKAKARVGKIHLDQVVFDSTKKLSIDTITFERIVR